MAPDRGNEPYSDHDASIADEALPSYDGTQDDSLVQTQSAPNAQKILAERASQPQNFTLRGILVGLVLGVVIAFSNTYFGLQTGWISGMTMPAALIGFAFFRAIKPVLKMAFTPVENVLIQTVAGSVGTMGLGCGFVGVIPAMEFLLHEDEVPDSGPLNLTFGKLCIWAIGICLFGVVFAVPLRREVIIREKLKFPSGTATALMIGVLHGDSKDAKIVKQQGEDNGPASQSEEHESLIRDNERRQREEQNHDPFASEAEMLEPTSQPFTLKSGADWKVKIRNMFIAFIISAAYTLFTYFVPQVREIPIFGLHMAQTWLWTLNPSPAYVGQGIIMGPATTSHMLFGAILGWGILSPLAKSKHWATGPVSDWERGSKGWIVWVSLAIMLADSIVSLGWLVLKLLAYFAKRQIPRFFRYVNSGELEDDWEDFKDALTWEHVRRSMKGNMTWKKSPNKLSAPREGYSTLPEDQGETSESLLEDAPPNAASAYAESAPARSRRTKRPKDEAEADAPPEHLVSWKAFFFWLIISIVLYYVSINVSFEHVIPFGLTTLALLLAMALSIMGVRALGETDLNPVSGISKLTQLFFAALVPNTNRNGVVINLIAGAVSESGALQAGDLLQDLKAGHLLGASPAAQFYGQIIGSLVGGVVSAGVYRLYVRVYQVPGPLFQIPTGFVWIFTARLVTGKGLPYMAGRFAIVFGAVFAVLTALRTKEMDSFAVRRWGFKRGWQAFVPGGIAVAVGMYNTPSFTLARFAGGCISFYWTRWRGRDETNVVVLASGLILGEGLVSIVNLLLAGWDVPHL